ncbi:MAG: YceI family protein [Woeseiaceae bacterium]
MMRNLFQLALVCVVVGLPACAPPVEKKVPTKGITLAEFPSDIYQSAAARGEPVYAIDSAESEVVILIYRGGLLAKMGHNHAVLSRDLHGFVLLAEDSDEAMADLYVPLKTLTVDESTKRAQSGFESSISEKDIAGTRRNMLEKVLDAESYPYAFIHIESDSSLYKHQVIKVDMTLNGFTRTMILPVEIERTKDKLGVSGKMVLRQTDFGMEPFSVFGGALRVKDEIIVNFLLQASRL